MCVVALVIARRSIAISGRLAIVNEDVGGARLVPSRCFAACKHTAIGTRNCVAVSNVSRWM